MIYRLGREIFKVAVRQFFGEIRISGAKPVEEGPLLVVPNHANFLIDSLLVTHAFKREFWFLAKSTLFANALFKWFLRNCHLVPVYRRMDNPEEVTKNDTTFRFVIEKLLEGRGIVIFPEGISQAQREVLPLKTGAARIALQAEDARDFSLGLKIQPLGITYVDFDQFRSSVTLTFGEPIGLTSYAAQYKEEPKAAVKQLISQIEQTLKELTVKISSADHQELVEKIAKLYKSRGSELDDKQRMQLVVRNVEALSDKHADRRKELESKLDKFLGMANELGMPSAVTLKTSFDPFFTLLVIPFVILGCILHFLPYRMIGPLARKLSTSPVSLGSLKLVLGLGLFLAWYMILFLVFIMCGMSFLPALLCLALLLASGYYANNYYYAVRVHMLSALWPGKKSPLSVLVMLRDELIKEFESIRIE